MKGHFRSLLSDPLTLACVIYVLLIVLIAATGPLFVDASLLRSNLRMRHFAPFQWEASPWMWLGGDALGRSIIARLILGGATTLAIATSTVTLSFVVGTMTGLVAASKNAWWSTLIMRVLDIVMSVPSLLLAMVILYTVGANPVVMVLVLCVGGLPEYARVARSQALEIRGRPFILASRVMGAAQWHLMFRHVGPNVVPTMFPMLALGLAGVMLAESTLTFLGIGIQPPAITWGLMVSEGREYLKTAWWESFWPGLLITSVAVSATIIGNWYQVMSDPVLRSRRLRRQ